MFGQITNIRKSQTSTLFKLVNSANKQNDDFRPPLFLFNLQ